MAQSILIIGAGMSGLTAGTVALRNAYSATILEAQPVSGGRCASWQRGGFRFDAGLEDFAGAAPDCPFHGLWRELGVSDQAESVPAPEEWVRVEGEEGRTLHIYTDLRRFEEHLLALSPADRDHITEFVRGIRGLASSEPRAARADRRSIRYARGSRNLWQRVVGYGLLRRWGRSSVSEFAADFEDPFLREAFVVAFGSPDYPMLGAIRRLGGLDRQSAGYSAGGAPAVVRNLEARFRELGGKLLHDSRVTKIIIERRRAVGVRLEDGTEYRADVVVSAADSHSTFFDLLRGAFLDERTRAAFSNLRTAPPQLLLNIGLSDAMEGLPALPGGLSFPLSSPRTVDGRRLLRLSFQSPGPTVVRVALESSYDRWMKLAEDPKTYEDEKAQVVAEVVGALDDRYPGLRDAIEVSDLVTPVSWERRTGSWRGSPLGWLLTPETYRLLLPRSLPGFPGFRMIGHWTWPGGGLAGAALSGRLAVQRLCRIDRKRFVTS
jgi:phytoene dehydrogenase-like protein